MNVEVFNLWAERALSLFWPMLWQSSILIVLLLVLEFALRRYVRAAVRYAVWLVVLVKLVLPPSLALPSGAAWWLRPPATAPLPRANHLLVVTYQNEHAPILPAQTIRTIPPPASPKISPAGAGLVLWAIVSIAFTALILAKWTLVARELRRATEAPDWLRRLLEDAAHCAGLRRTPRLRLTEQPVSPALCGLVRPIVLVPRALVEQLPTNQLRSILVHELTHLRRADLWVNCAQALLQAVYWWQPLLWLANARIRCVREEAVDDGVMQTLREQAEDYAPTLLRVARLTLRRPLATLGLVGILESPTLLRRRVERLLIQRAPRRAGLTFVWFLGVLGFAAVAVPMGPSPAPNSGAARSNEPPQLYTRLFKVDPNTFIQGLKSVGGWSDGGMPPESSNIRKFEFPENGPVQEQVREFFKSMGVDFTPPKTLYYKNREGALLVRATRAEIDTIEQAVQVLNVAPPNGGQPPGTEPSRAAPVTRTPATTPDGKASHASTLVQDGKLLYEMSKLDEAEKRLRLALEKDAANKAVLYYLNLVEEARRRQTLDSRASVKPLPSPGAKGSPGRLAIFSALDHIRFESVKFEKVPLAEVVRYLNEKARRRDPNGKGVNFIINPGQNAAEASAGQPAPVDISSLSITINPPLRDIRLADVLDAIIKVAETPLKYSIEDYAVVFTRKLNGPPALYTRVFKLDPNTFIQGLESVVGSNVLSNDIDGRRPQKLQSVLREFFTSVGVDLAPPKTLFFNDREGSLLVRATLADLDAIENAVQVLNISPPQLNLKTRFYAVPQHSALSIWDVVGGTNLASRENSSFTTIMTPAQSQVLLKALESAAGVELLGQGSVTTLSGRHTQIQAVDLKTVATNINPQALSPPGISTNADALYLSTQVPLGPTLDVIPYVSADGWTIQATVTPSLTEFQGYDTPTNHVKGYIEGKETSVPLPLPHFRITQVTTTAVVGDGQTLLVGTPPHAGTPQAKSRQLLVTLTPMVIDPAGNRIRFHDEDREYRIVDPNLANRTNH